MINWHIIEYKNADFYKKNQMWFKWFFKLYNQSWYSKHYVWFFLMNIKIMIISLHYLMKCTTKSNEIIIKID